MPVDPRGYVFDGPLLTAAEAAERLRTTTYAIDEARRTGELVAVVIGKRYVFTLRDLDDYVAAHRDTEGGIVETADYTTFGGHVLTRTDARE